MKVNKPFPRPQCGRREDLKVGGKKPSHMLVPTEFYHLVLTDFFYLLHVLLLVLHGILLVLQKLLCRVPSLYNLQLIRLTLNTL